MELVLLFLLGVAVAGLYTSFSNRRMYVITLAGASVVALAFLQFYGMMQ